MGLTHSPRIVTDGLVLCLDAANSRSYPKTGTTWTDLKGGNNGTLNNMDASNFSTDNGGTLTFDGTNEAVRFSTYTQPQYTTTTDFTWCIWFMSLAASSNNIVMGNRYYGTGCGTGSPYAFVKLTTRKFEFVNSQNTSITHSISTNVWQFVTIIKSGSTISYYKDTEFIGSLTNTGTFPAAPRFFIGGDQCHEFCNIKFSCAHVYDRALSTDEIRQNYLSTKERFA